MSPADPLDDPSWRKFFFGTPTRCHLTGGIASLVLSLITAWIWFYPDLFSGGQEFTAEDLTEAVTLIAARDDMRQTYIETSRKNRLLKVESDSHRGWLPTDRSWSGVRSELQQLAAQSQVQLTTLERAGEHFGSRVAVIDCTCEIEGGYADIRNFLQGLVDLEKPIWCDEVRIVREDDFQQPGGVNRSAPALCVATLSLRVPYAGEGTAAYKLFQAGGSDVSR